MYCYCGECEYSDKSGQKMPEDRFSFCFWKESCRNTYWNKQQVQYGQKPKKSLKEIQEELNKKAKNAAKQEKQDKIFVKTAEEIFTQLPYKD